jgi:hypothetical protein
MDRRWRVQPDQAYQITEEEYIGVVSREALTEAILDGIPLLDRAGGVLTVIVGRTKTGYPGEAVTTGAAIQWKSGPRAPSQPEADVDAPGVEAVQGEVEPGEDVLAGQPDVPPEQTELPVEPADEDEDQSAIPVELRT